jgi:hypothetical protein
MTDRSLSIKPPSCVSQPSRINGTLPIPNTRILFFICLLYVLFSSTILNAQGKPGLKDSLDGKLDMSDWVLTAHGFIPVPVLITEPALGGIGGALMLVFISRNKPYIDTVDHKIVTERVRPTIYGAGAAYTANGTWLVAGGYSGLIRKWRARYRILAGFANMNLTFYKEIPQTGESSFEFNIQAIPVSAQFLKQIRKSSWYAGFNYMFLKTELKRTNAEFHTPQEIKSTISRLGLLVEYDHRDNNFTPDKGLLWNTVLGASDQVIGSDYDYTMANSAAFLYIPAASNLITGFRMEYQEVWGDVPFYLKPFINMRGIPVARYQGNITTLGETEIRWDFTRRFSAVAFGGAGKAIDQWSDFKDAQWHASGGAGGRYLIARKLKLRMGIDVARGPEQWAYYMVFGTSWVR